MNKEIQQKLTTIVNALKEELSNIHTNRPNARLIEEVKVNYMDMEMPVKQLGTITVELPRDIIISPWDKGCIPALEKALTESGKGSVVNQGSLIRVKLPEITMERRTEIEKIMKAAAEQSRIRIRMLRDESIKKLKDLKDEDERFRGKDDIQREVDKANKEIEELVAGKSKEIAG